MATLKQKVVSLMRSFGRPGDAKYEKDGLEYPDTKPIEVPLRLLQKHQDAQEFIKAYVNSQVAEALKGTERETLEEAMDFDVDGGEPEDMRTARELEAEHLAHMANDSFELRRYKELIDRDRAIKKRKYRKPAAAADGAATTTKPGDSQEGDKSKSVDNATPST